MDMLAKAVSDITTLAATCHVLRASEDPATPDSRLLHRQRREIKRATLAYVETLGSSRVTVDDDELLQACRRTAEVQMPNAMQHQRQLGQMLGSMAGALDNLAAIRHDLWRLAHMARQLHLELAALQAADQRPMARTVQELVDRLRRRLRKALIAYVRSMLRSKPAPAQRVLAAREEALAAIGARGAALARRLVDLDADHARQQPRRTLSQAMLDLALDWRHCGPVLA